MPNRSLTIAQVLTLLAEQPHVVLGACISIVSFVPAYFAWKLPPKDFVAWYKSQALFSNPRSGQPLFSYLSDDDLRGQSVRSPDHWPRGHLCDSLVRTLSG